MVGDSNDETIFWNELLLIDMQVSRICKAFENSFSANRKFMKLDYTDGRISSFSWQFGECSR